MKAVIMNQYGSPEVLHVQEVPKPEPQAHEVRIKIKACSVTTADTFLRTGTPYFARLVVGILKPKISIPGTGFAGVVEAIGPEVQNFKVGDRVYGMAGMEFGAHAEYICVDSAGILQPIPEGLDFDEAAPLCDGAMTAYNFLQHVTHLKAGQRILINGASGSVGSAAVQIAKYLGAHVTGMCGPANLEWVKGLGADEVIDYHHTDFTQKGEQYDVIFDAVGKRNFKECKAALTPDGEYISPVLNFNLLLNMLWSSKMGRQKAKFSSTGLLPVAEQNRYLDTLNRLVITQDLKPLVERRYAMENITEAHQYLDTGHKRGNIVLALSH